MQAFGFAALFGLILGFMFGVGCAFAVLYTIYMGGYKKALADQLSEPHPDRYHKAMHQVRTRLNRKPKPTRQT